MCKFFQNEGTGFILNNNGTTMAPLLFKMNPVPATTLYTGRKATFPASLFTKDIQRTGQISYTCLAPVLIRIVENFYDMS